MTTDRSSGSNRALIATFVLLLIAEAVAWFLAVPRVITVVLALAAVVCLVLAVVLRVRPR